MDEQSNNQLTVINPVKMNEFVTSNIIDLLLNKLRDSQFITSFENFQKRFIQYGLYGLYLSLIIGLITAITIPIKYDKVSWGASLALGIGFIVYCVISHYVAVKFLPYIDIVLKRTPSKMGSTIFLDCFAFLFLISGFSLLLIGLVLAISESEFMLFLLGFFGFLLCEYTVCLSLSPQKVNISIEEQLSAAQELLGVTSFLVKSSLKMVPITFFACMVLGIVKLVGILFSNYQYMVEIDSDIFQIGFIYLGALTPVISYIIFLSYHFMIDIGFSILSLNDKK